MICPKCNNQYDIYNAVIAEDKENEGRWICPECKVPLNDSDADPAFPTLEYKIKQAITDIIGEDRPFMVVPDIAEEITQNVRRIVEQQGPKNPPLTPPKMGIVESPPKKEVVVTVTGGVADVEQIPPGIIVKIRDYDIEGYDEDKLMQDKEGNRYIEAVFIEDGLSYIGNDDDGDPY